MGVTWRDGGAEVRLTEATGVRTVQTAYALSTSGPHHVELVQSIPGTVWSVTAPGHAHHLGYWVDDVPSAAAELVRLGSEQVASVADQGRPAADVHVPPITAAGCTSRSSIDGCEPVLLPDS